MSTTRLGVLTDVHLVFEGTNRVGSRVPDIDGWDLAGTADRLQAAIGVLEGQSVDGVVLLGDLAHHGDGETIDRVLADLGRLPGGLWAAAGNHDVAVRHNAVSRALGRVRGDRSQALGNGYRLTVLEIESVDWIMLCRARAHPALLQTGEGLDLVLSHFPLLAPEGREEEPGIQLVDNDVLLEALAAHPGPTVVLSGHLHLRAARAHGRLLQLIFPAIVEVPAHCSVVELTEAEGRRRVRRSVFLLDGQAVQDADVWEYDGERWIDVAYGG